nr:RAD9, HUS1, RAD1-interacting nuclear orphan protein 1 isoform X2 [Taeniopygia guttata]
MGGSGGGYGCAGGTGPGSRRHRAVPPSYRDGRSRPAAAVPAASFNHAARGWEPCRAPGPPAARWLLVKGCGVLPFNVCVTAAPGWRGQQDPRARCHLGMPTI